MAAKKRAREILEFIRKDCRDKKSLCQTIDIIITNIRRDLGNHCFFENGTKPKPLHYKKRRIIEEWCRLLERYAHMFLEGSDEIQK